MFTKKPKFGRKPMLLLAGALFGAMAIGAASSLSNPVGVNAINLSHNGIFQADFSSAAEALEAAHKLNVEIASEGDVLLKNDGTLPFNGREKISVFGAAQDSFVGGNGSISLPVALQNAGFDVNQKLASYYGSVGTTVGTEPIPTEAQSYEFYHDAAVLILRRDGSEGGDLKMMTNEAEDNKDGDGNDYEWEHAALGSKKINNVDTEVKHYLELTDSEEALLAHIKKNFKKIVVVLNTSNAMEMGNLQDDPAINGLILMGRPGSNGIEGLAKILNGEVNPSGKLVDEWMRDFTLDPTWQNMASNLQVASFGNAYTYTTGIRPFDGGTAVPGKATASDGSATVGPDGYYGVDYDEGIYVGYRYYETVYAELVKDATIRFDAATKLIKPKAEVTGDYNAQAAADAWWEFAVVYPFGYGLSYTEFDQSIGDIYYMNGNSKVNLASSVAPELFNSNKTDGPAQVEKLYVPVTVTNTGNVAGKQVVQIYVTPPYIAGEVEKAEVNLVGFAKTGLLRPGQSEKVIVEINVQDFASFDYNDANENSERSYELDAGQYSIKVMSDSHRVEDSYEFTLTGDAILDLDDFSHKEVTPVFSNGDSFDTIRANRATGDEDKFLDITKTDAGEQKLLSRGDLSVVDAQGLVPTEAEADLTDEFALSIAFFTGYNTNDQAHYADDAVYVRPAV
ncbi:MAG: glycoside hydrolase family 3 C-terminal domain-containing protein, partial [Bacilli bacterium]|nr:glycoside hydrolase family 3 C-terminal domain-containing protein [Bacilli bacterium]